MKKKKIIINCNDTFAVYTFRLNLIKTLLVDYDVYVIAKYDIYTPMMEQLIKTELKGLTLIIVDIDSANKHLFKDFLLYLKYRKLFRKIKPDLIINYTVKPHTLGSLAKTRKAKIINVVTGTGTAFLKRNLTFKIVKALYICVSKKVNHYIFLNQEDYHEFRDLKLIKNNYSFLNSEGVDLKKFYPHVDFTLPITFIFIGRLVEEKGIYEYLDAAKMIKNKYPKVRFLVAGSLYKKQTSISKKILDDCTSLGIIEYLGHVYDMEEVLRSVHVVVLPSYKEEMPISLIEGLASKKVLIASDVRGSKQIVIDKYNGFLCKVKSSHDLYLKMVDYIAYPNKEQLHENAYESAIQYDQALINKEMITIIRGLL